ncbi:MAG: UDP-N-acetylmuramoyl-tripeptide--D-alanyl-D-alanine ligase [Neisseriaceae bacterium]|nr:MAG: UDP-N-acetylmuramoyl-tripeptide--D-alanyl-D-alanine ligase [Neisseriaceae bacterium]
MKLSFIYNTFNQFNRFPDVEVRNIVTDSRIAQQGDVFFAIKGVNFDGHQFIDDVLSKGVLAVIASDSTVKNDKIILVDDTVKSLGLLASKWRQEINPYVLGITGSSGKTTVKELTATILKSIYGQDNVLWTQGNLNNHLGVPLTLLKLSAAHRFAVIEMGMNHFGELSYLTQIVKPNIVLINNILRAHIGCGFKNLEGIALAKSEVLQELDDAGTAVLPKDSPQFEFLLQQAAGHLVRTFGLESGDIYTTNIKTEAFFSECTVHTPIGIEKIHIPLPGVHNISNVLAALALVTGIPDIQLIDIINSLSLYQSKPGRLFISRLNNGSDLIDDSYNANPDSMKVALSVLANMPNQKIFVMGDMGELGANAQVIHQEIGQYAKQIGVDYLLAIGNMSLFAVDGFGHCAEHYQNKHDLLVRLEKLLCENSSILVKGSRFMRMEEISQSIRNM